jgi:hypothetical protein
MILAFFRRIWTETLVHLKSFRAREAAVVRFFSKALMLYLANWHSFGIIPMQSKTPLRSACS